MVIITKYKRTACFFIRLFNSSHLVMTTGFEPRYSLVGSTFVSTMTLAQIHQNNYEILSTFQFCAIMVDYLFTLLDTVCAETDFKNYFILIFGSAEEWQQKMPSI